MKDKIQGDDLILNRLFTLLNQYLPFPVRKIIQIRKNVYYVVSEQIPFILKGFSTIESLRLQETYTTSLRNEGFEQTYSFYRLVNQPIFFKEKYFGLIEFIESHPQPFTYHSHENRMAGLELLHAYHTKTKPLINQFSTVLPRFNLEEKWQERMNVFLSNLPYIQYYLNDHMIREILSWANESLVGLQTEIKSFLNDSPVILHGDVAHHNFLKTKNGDLYLIDFDLISIGDQRADLLQYANRILPALNWSLFRLAEYPHLQFNLQNRAFLWGLMYPTDIFREWNRIIKDKSDQQPRNLFMVMDLTIRQFHLRKKFIKDLKNMIK